MAGPGESAPALVDFKINGLEVSRLMEKNSRYFVFFRVNGVLLTSSRAV
jgi:hypothetical protein